MSWTLQGYNSQRFNPTLGFKSDYWFVECNGDEDDFIEGFYNRVVDLGGWNDKIKIIYGCSGVEFFRGYLLTDDIEKAKSLIKKFNHFPVYQSKYGGVKKFHFKNLTFISFLGILLFFETNPKNIIDEPFSMNDIVRALFSELEFGINQGFIDNSNQSLDEIKKHLESKISTVNNT